MDHEEQMRCTAFEGYRRIASGKLAEVALKVKKVLERGERAPVLIFDDLTGEQIELDLRGSAKDVWTRLAGRTFEGAPASADVEPAEPSPRGPGRPRLGVVAREVTLLPRHWDWLNSQPGGASVALRKLVEEARRANEGKDRVRAAQEVVYGVMPALAGNLPGFEEAIRALFARNRAIFEWHILNWPIDVRSYLERLVQESRLFEDIVLVHESRPDGS